MTVDAAVSADGYLVLRSFFDAGALRHEVELAIDDGAVATPLRFREGGVTLR